MALLIAIMSLVDFCVIPVTQVVRDHNGYFHPKSKAGKQLDICETQFMKYKPPQKPSITVKTSSWRELLKSKISNKDKLHDSHSHLLKILNTSLTVYSTTQSHFYWRISSHHRFPPLPRSLVRKQCCMARIRFLVTTPYWTSTAALTT